MLSLHGPQDLSGTVEISGSKNAALPLIACGLFFQKFTLHNVPRIGDVVTFLSIIESLGVMVDFAGNTLIMDSTNMSMDNLNTELVKKIRVGIFLFPALLKRFRTLEIPFPGGCNIGKRPIDEHVRGFEAFGYKNEGSGDMLHFSGNYSTNNVRISAGFAVTATENILMIAAFRSGTTIIELAAIEPHVLNLIDFLRTVGVTIEISHDHTITVEGLKFAPEEAETTVIHDYIESGTFVILGALTATPTLEIKHARINDLRFFLAKCKEAGVRFSLNEEKDSITVYNSRSSLKAVNFQTNIYPGFPTDLQSPFSLLLTQAEGISRVHEVLFEGRLNWLVEIEKMKGHIAIMNPHEALIFGKTHLKGAMVSSWDLRAGVTMILAGMVARGETTITNVEYIERGYEDIIGKIKKLGGKINHV
ncbi:UDP-N-acetylglucosamine 1-carboxyvinyltransferase [Candidatus Gracilibacteria bacterium]|nr:UDP-N-acetylglucosamine 1-carboxyvinyltransferase [Candidatus Gracilibacteria bacterium]